MVKKGFHLILFFLICTEVSGQERVTVRVGEDANEVLSLGRYLFPQFEDALVIFGNGTRNNAKMNYNALSGQMEFMDPDGTTFVLSGKPQVVAFGTRVFKHSPKGYLEVISTDLQADFLIHRQFKVSSRRKRGAYGTSSDIASIDAWQSVDINHSRVALSPDEEVSYTKTYTYYVFSEGKYRLANRSGFAKIFGKQHIDKYLAEHPVNFNKQDDLIRLFTYCTQK